MNLASNLHCLIRFFGTFILKDQETRTTYPVVVARNGMSSQFVIEGFSAGFFFILGGLLQLQFSSLYLCHCLIFFSYSYRRCSSPSKQQYFQTFWNRNYCFFICSPEYVHESEDAWFVLVFYDYFIYLYYFRLPILNERDIQEFHFTSISNCIFFHFRLINNAYYCEQQVFSEDSDRLQIKLKVKLQGS